MWVLELSRLEEATSKDEVEIVKFAGAEIQNTQYKTKSNINARKKVCESLKESRAIEDIPANELDLLLSKFFISVRKQNGTEYEPGTLSGFQRRFQRHLHEKEVWLTFLRITSFPSPERYLLPNERTWFGKEKETVEMAQKSSLEPKKMHYLKMASSLFRFRNHYKGLCGGFFLSIFAWELEMKAVSCAGEMIPYVEVRKSSKTRTGHWWWSKKSAAWTESAHKQQQVEMPSWILQSF